MTGKQQRQELERRPTCKTRKVLSQKAKNKNKQLYVAVMNPRKTALTGLIFVSFLLNVSSTIFPQKDTKLTILLRIPNSHTHPPVAEVQFALVMLLNILKNQNSEYHCFTSLSCCEELCSKHCYKELFLVQNR